MAGKPTNEQSSKRGPEKQPQGRSRKAHLPPPPTSLGSSGGKSWGGHRGDIGEFTGEGSPGLEKK